jgi:hypothetical protein
MKGDIAGWQPRPPETSSIFFYLKSILRLLLTRRGIKIRHCKGDVCCSLREAANYFHELKDAISVTGDSFLVKDLLNFTHVLE